jgi:hypothetical protein
MNIEFEGRQLNLSLPIKRCYTVLGSDMDRTILINTTASHSKLIHCHVDLYMSF